MPLPSQHRVPISHSARKLAKSDFTQFTHILAADESNLSDIQRMKPANSTAEIRLWGSYLDDKAIPDPWYGGLVSLHYLVFWMNLIRLQSGFEDTFKQCTALSSAFLDAVFGKAED